jgi:hypothetical protein
MKALGRFVLIIALLAYPMIGARGQSSAVDASPQWLLPPSGFRGIALGMDIAAVKEVLKSDPLFGYKGDPDVSFLPRTSETLIECEGRSYVSRAYFQFEKGRLLTMILALNAKLIDHYSLFTSFSLKYGKPAIFDPTAAVWLSDDVRFSLERPLTVKYIERKTFDAVTKAGKAEMDLEGMARERFIDQF